MLCPSPAQDGRVITNVAISLLAALALTASGRSTTGVPEPPGEIGSWSAKDRREFMEACRTLKAGEEACACLLGVFERHVASLEEFRESYDQAKEDAMAREGARCERMSTIP
jgi:hypothetical protein